MEMLFKFFDRILGGNLFRFGEYLAVGGEEP